MSEPRRIPESSNTVILSPTASAISGSISIVAAALLVAIGFALHTAASVRARRLQFAQLRAIGLSRRSLVGVVGAESLILCAIGTVFGIAIGVLLSWMVGPLVAVSPDDFLGTFLCDPAHVTVSVTDAVMLPPTTK